jgi:excinuclease UvrABC nuclease subunit
LRILVFSDEVTPYHAFVSIDLANLLPQRIDFDPAVDFEVFRKQVPARWVVYLMTDAEDRPIQLLCVKNLRSSLERRLQGEETIGPSRRVNYREVVRRIYWRRVDSALEADVVYLEAARELFPATYQGMVGFRPAWFVHVNPEANFPRYTKTHDLAMRTGTYVGPVEDKHAAARLIELIEDQFDLCRYYNILVLAPNAKPCAYKEMGKCPAPCDGSISMEQYRRMIEWSLSTLVDPAEMIRQQTRRMQAAATDLKFELAAKIKAFVDSLSQWGKGQFRYVRRLKDFAYLSFQHGPRDGLAKVFLITPGRIDEIAGLIGEPQRPSELMRVAFAVSAEQSTSALDVAGMQRIGVVAHHLFIAKANHGVFLPLETLEEKQVIKAYRDLLKQKPADITEGEGVLKELQAL